MGIHRRKLAWNECRNVCDASWGCDTWCSSLGGLACFLYEMCSGTLKPRAGRGAWGHQIFFCVSTRLPLQPFSSRFPARCACPGRPGCYRHWADYKQADALGHASPFLGSWLMHSHRASHSSVLLFQAISAPLPSPCPHPPISSRGCPALTLCRTQGLAFPGPGAGTLEGLQEVMTSCL